jgi:hypothetical protein
MFIIIFIKDLLQNHFCFWLSTADNKKQKTRNEKRNIMSLSIKKIKTLTVELDTRPGSLCHVFNAFKEAFVYVQSSWAYEMGPDKAEVIFCVSDANKAEEVLKLMDKTPHLSHAICAEGDDYTGAYAELLNKIAAKNISINATDAQAVGSKFVAVFFADDENLEKMCSLFDL